MDKNIDKRKKKGPKASPSKAIDHDKLLAEEMNRHLNETGRLDNDDVSRLESIAQEYGSDKALAMMDQIVLDKILADRSAKLQEYKDQRSGDIGFA